MAYGGYEPVGLGRQRSIWTSPRFWVAVPVIMLIGGYFAWLALKPDPVPVTLDSFGCEKGVQRNTTLIFIDVSDSFSPYEKARFKEIWPTVVDKTGQGDFVGVTYIDGNGDGDPIFRGCKPDDGKWSIIKGLQHPDQDPNSVQGVFKKQFMQPISQVAGQDRLEHHSKSSPITRSITTTIQDVDEFWSRASVRHVIIFSDMIENDRATFISTPPYTRLLEKIKRAQEYPFLPSLRNTDVKVFYLAGRPRDRSLQGYQHKSFWQKLFSDAGVSADALTFEEVTFANPRGE